MINLIKNNTNGRERFGDQKITFLEIQELYNQFLHFRFIMMMYLPVSVFVN